MELKRKEGLYSNGRRAEYSDQDGSRSGLYQTMNLQTGLHQELDRNSLYTPRSSKPMSFCELSASFQGVTLKGLDTSGRLG